MRIAHLVLIVAVLALGMSLTREPMGRVFVIVFLTGVGELVLALAAIMALFQTVGGSRRGADAIRSLRSVRSDGDRPRGRFDGDVRLDVRGSVDGGHVRVRISASRRDALVFREFPLRQPFLNSFVSAIINPLL